MKNLAAIVLLSLAAIASSQGTPPDENARQAWENQKQTNARRSQAIRDAELNGIPVELAAISGFRGARTNVVVGYGLVVGLNGTGDSKQVSVTSTAMANALSRWGTLVDAASFKSKNIAIVSITAEIHPFAAPGRKVDLTVQSLGDCKSLQGGVLLPTPMGTMVDTTVNYVMAAGPVSIGGFNADGGGNIVRKNHPTVGRVPDGGDILRSIDTQFVFAGNVLYLDLDDPDFTTAQRTANRIKETFPNFGVHAMDAVTIAITIPSADDAVAIVGQIQKLEVRANTEPTVVINPRTGTIVIGGNVRLGPALIAHGSLRVRIDTEFVTSQPLPLSQGQTTVVPDQRTSAREDPPQIVVIAPNASLDDLAKIFQAMDVSARDIIAILQALGQQGALKARIKIQ